MQLMLDTVITIWDSILNAGVDSSMKDNTRKKIRLTNAMSLSLAVVSFPFVLYFSYLGYFVQGLGVFLVDLAFLTAIYFNSKKKHTIAKIIILALVNFAAFPYALFFGLHSGIQYVYLPFSCLSFVLFELKDWKYIVISILVSVYVFLEGHLQILSIPIQPVEADIQVKVYFPMMLVVFSLIILNIFYVSRESEIVEDAINKAKKNFEIQVKEARQVVLNSSYTQKSSIAGILSAQLSDLKKSEEELRNSNEYLQRINDDLDCFVYTASHDLKSPISNIEGLINVLASHRFYKQEEVKEIIDMMSLSVSKFKSTINELVEVSKIEKEGASDLETIDFYELLEDVKFSINELIKVSHVQIISDFSCAPRICFSKKNMRSIFYNLLSNAIKYQSHDRSPVVHITTLKGDNDSIVLSIEDNGLGISEENIPKIFSMFKRVHDHVEGSGVGLYIVKKIIENNHGTIAVQSKVGAGSKFILSFKME